MFGQMGRSTGSCIVSSAASRSSPEAVSAVLSTSSGTLPLLAGRPAMARLDTVWLKREATPSPYGLLYEALRTSRRIVRFLSFPCGVSRYNSFSERLDPAWCHLPSPWNLAGFCLSCNRALPGSRSSIRRACCSKKRMRTCGEAAIAARAG